MRKWKISPHRPEPWTRWDTVVYTTTITVLCTACTLAALIWWPGSDAAWLVLTVLVVSQVGIDANVKRTLHRIAGTIVGVAIAALVASVTDSEPVVTAIALVCTVIFVVIEIGPHSYFLHTVFLTPTVVLTTAASVSDVDKTDEERLAFTLIAVALLMLASGIALGFPRYQQAHSPSPSGATR